MSKTSRRPVPGAAQITGAPPTVTVGAKVYRLGFNTQDAKGRLEALIHDHVTVTAIRAKRRIGGPEGEESYAAAKSLLDGGHYLTLAKGWLDVLNSPDGALLFPLSLFQEYHPEMTADDCRRVLDAEPEQVRAALGRVAPDFFRAALLQVVRGQGVAGAEAAAVDRIMGDPAVRAGVAGVAGGAPGPGTG